MLPWLHVSSMPPPGGDCPPSSSIAALMLFLQRGIRCCFCSSSRPARQRQPCSSSALRTAALVPALARVNCSGAQPEWAQAPHKSTDVQVVRCFCSKVAWCPATALQRQCAVLKWSAVLMLAQVHNCRCRLQLGGTKAVQWDSAAHPWWIASTLQSTSNANSNLNKSQWWCRLKCSCSCTMSTVAFQDCQL